MQTRMKLIPTRLAPEPSNSHRVCVAIPASLLAEAQREALRLDRSLSWIFQQAWRLSRQRVGKLPAAEVSGVSAPAPRTRPRRA